MHHVEAGDNQPRRERLGSISADPYVAAERPGDLDGVPKGLPGNITPLQRIPGHTFLV